MYGDENIKASESVSAKAWRNSGVALNNGMARNGIEGVA